MMLELFELLLSVLFESLLPALLEFGAEWGLEALFEIELRYSYLATIGYFILGLLVGAASVYFFPAALIQRPFIPGASLILSPLVGGATMAGFDALVHKHEAHPKMKFLHGVAFSFAIAVVRFVFAQ